jgi:hypothetical protein
MNVREIVCWNHLMLKNKFKFVLNYSKWRKTVMENRRYFVFRIDSSSSFTSDLRKEIEHGRLRQGWGSNNLNINQSFEDFNNSWLWDSVEVKGRRNRYSILRIMLEMKPGDIIIVPKCFSYGRFALLEVAESYKFDESESVFGKVDDFRHIIGINPNKTVEVLNNGSEESLNIMKSLRGYQDAINRIHKNSIINAIEVILKDENRRVNSNNEVFESIEVEKTDFYVEMISSLKQRMNNISGVAFQNLVKNLFIKSGYEFQEENVYDGEGGDIDLIFAMPIGELVNDILGLSINAIVPRINIQVKNKSGNDHNDINGVNQLKRMCRQGDINILINITNEFTEECKIAAQNSNVILVNWAAFAKLYLQYN